MLFDLDKARRHFDNYVRFAVEGGIDKDALLKATIGAIAWEKEFKNWKQFQTIQSIVKQVVKEFGGNYYRETERACQKIPGLAKGAEQYEKLFGKKQPLPEPVSEDDVYLYMSVRSPIFIGVIKDKYKELTGEAPEGLENEIKAMREKVRDEYNRMIKQEAKRIATECNRKLVDCERRAGLI